MLGHRGCRLGITYPEITTMQARAIFEAALAVSKKGTPVKPEIMIPLVGHVEELKRQKAIVLEAADEVLGKDGSGVEYLVGTMIEVPRAALTADEIAKEAEFFSFGTNDLTQMSFGFSRDDAGKFLLYYQEHGILAKDPFVSIDAAGVGRSSRSASRRAAAQAEPQDRHLRRARRRPRLDPSSSTRSGSTTCPARRTACRSRGWRRRRRSSSKPSGRLSPPRGRRPRFGPA